MSLAWLDWSNPVAIWWGFLLAVSAINIAVSDHRGRVPSRLSRNNRRP